MNWTDRIVIAMGEETPVTHADCSTILEAIKEQLTDLVRGDGRTP